MKATVECCGFGGGKTGQLPPSATNRRGAKFTQKLINAARCNDVDFSYPIKNKKHHHVLHRLYRKALNGSFYRAPVKTVMMEQKQSILFVYFHQLKLILDKPVRILIALDDPTNPNYQHCLIGICDSCP